MDVAVTIDASTDRLEQFLSDSERAIARIRSSQMEALRELDRRQVPLSDGCRSLREWAAGRMDLAPETAANLVRTARALEGCERLEAAAHIGEASFDRITELSRHGDAVADDLETHLDVAGVRRKIARKRRRTRGSERETFRDRYLAIQPSLDESFWRLHGQLPGLAGRVVEKALHQHGDELPDLPGAEMSSRGQRNADALVMIAQDSLDGGTEDAAALAGPHVTVFVDAVAAAPTNGEAGVTIAAGPRVGPETLAMVMCTGTVEVTARTEDGTPLGIGTASRVVPPKLRRHVLSRDGGCTADGCTSRYRLEPHHVTEASHGGRTDADNLTTLCWFHHHVVVHGHGFRIDPDSPRGRCRFMRTADRDPP